MYSSHFFNRLCFVFAVALLFADCKQDHPETENRTAENYAVGTSNYVLSVEELATLLTLPSPPLLVEISKPEEYAKGHLPGAINLWRPAYEDQENYPYGGIRASRSKMTALLRELGLKNDGLLIVYCTKGNADAARLLWIMRGYGHDRIALLDGGKSAWRHAALPLTQDTTPHRTVSKYHFPKGFKQTDYASFHDVIAAVSDTSFILIDTREDYEYLGIPYPVGSNIVPFKPGAFIQGAIPGAIHMNWSESVDLHGDHTFKSATDLEHNFRSRGITPDKKIIVYCQSGVRSAHTTFVLSELLDYPDVSNYDGSWIEWSYLHINADLVPVKHHTSAEATRQIHEDLVTRTTFNLKQ